MRKSLLLKFFWCLLVLYSFPAVAQQKTVTGRITDESGTPLTDVSVTVKGTSTATKTNANGDFTISAPNIQTLVLSYVDFRVQEVNVSNRSTINISLSRKQQQLDEVIVTAMDIKKTAKEVPYAVQQVDGEELQQTQRENFVNALQGRVAGLTINSTGGQAGSSSQIVLRGFNSMTLDNTPLFVIDGIIADNSTLSESGGGASLGLADNPANSNRANDYNNRISDINPNDIESITVLKGPEATALYGSQASSGAIIITTKKAKPNGKLGVSYDNSFRWEKYNRMPSTMDAFMGGDNGVAKDQFTSFGPKYPAGTPLYKNIRNFFETGFSQTHNLSAEYGKKNASFRLSTSLFNQDGIIPANTYNRYNVKLSNNTRIGKYITISPAIQYIKTDNDKPIRGAAGYMISLLAWPADNDIRNWSDDNGLKIPLFSANPNSDFDNPLYSVYKNRSVDKTDRIIANMGIDIKPFKWLTVAGRFGYDTYSTDGYAIYDSMSYVLTRAQKGMLRNYYRDYYGYNHTITATATKQVKDFGFRLMTGNMWQDYETQQWSVTGTNLTDPNRTDSNNTDPTTRIRLNNNQTKGLPNYSIRRSIAYFGEFAVNWKKMIYLSYTHRFEESSVYPKKARNYNFPAGGVSIIMSDLIPGIKSSTFNYWKLRGSLASTARSIPPYSNQSVFNLATATSGGGYYYSFENNNPEIVPERQQTYEFGTEIRAFNNRLNVDATYYNTKNTNLIGVDFRFSYGSGYVLNTLNVGSNRNRGLEIAVGLDAVQGKRFSWNTRFNFNKMWNKVLTLPTNVPEFYDAQTNLYGNARGGIVVGGSTTTITSWGYARNKAGQILINPLTGLPVIDQTFKVRGDRNPDFTLGWLNTFSMGRFRLNFLWDIKVGGDIFNATDDYLTGIGRSWRTYDRYVSRVLDGVLQDGLEETASPTKNTIAVTPGYNQNYYTLMPEEEFVEKDINWVRLRDVSLYYRFGDGVTKNLKVKSLSAFVTIVEPILFTNYRGTDPQSNGLTAGSRGVGGFGFDYANIGAPVGVNVGIKANF